TPPCASTDACSASSRSSSPSPSRRGCGEAATPKRPVGPPRAPRRAARRRPRAALRRSAPRRPRPLRARTRPPRAPMPRTPAAPPGYAPKSASPGDAIPGGSLAANEDGGGHTLSRHVGRSDADLERRARDEGKREVSTFDDPATAENAVAAVLYAHRADVAT